MEIENEMEVSHETELENQVEEQEQPQVEEPASDETPAEEPEHAEESESEEPAEGEEGEHEEEAAYKPNLTFKAGAYNKDTKQFDQKEYQIDPKFQSLMTDPESEKMVRELHEKAYGLESVKERLSEAKTFTQELSRENTDIKGSIQRAKSIYGSAVKTGNWHKLDDFFGMLDIPQEHVLKYALAKVELNEMDPTQRNAIMGRLEAERQAETLQQEHQSQMQSHVTLAQQNKALQIDFAMSQPEIAELAKTFDERTGKPGSFKEAIYSEGSLAWAMEKADLPANEAVQRVVKKYGLSGQGQQAQSQNNPGAKPGNGLVPRKTPPATLPNISGRSTSPITNNKPKSLDDIIKYRKETHGF